MQIKIPFSFRTFYQLDKHSRQFERDEMPNLEKCQMFEKNQFMLVKKIVDTKL